MQENNKIDFKIGDLVTIKSRPEYWSSLCCDKDPIDNTSPIKYPYTAKKDLITNVNPTENEIIPIPEKLMSVWNKGGMYKYKRIVFAKIGNKVLAWDNYEKTFAAVLDFAEEIQ